MKNDTETTKFKWLNGIGSSTDQLNVPQRVVSEVDRTVAQGWRQFVTRVLGTLPAPLLFGYIIDNACTIWRTNFDGKQGNCWVYDLDR